MGGNTGMYWDQLQDVLGRHSRQDPGETDLLVVHLRGNDLAQLGSKELLESIRRGLIGASMLRGSTNMLWSEIVPRQMCLVHQHL
ncbi:hypothetical protein NDU88_004861 [Pleurodeles waltl]|uniref:Uncharacterized protein n=1 Tax=Pleurodeles waltl TaxID=8319 RepID=A0AAV7TAL5_PLEWA|nr:hypothetical protein NDU88_004860 [Pleurodeles waltl]KAJ1173019.1 hypothetical protein NDU88_004861 [Pleurodeles waltl]